MHLVVALAVALLAPMAAHADMTPGRTSWLVSPAFGKGDDARKALSGAACVAGTHHCIAVNDEKKYAQFFDIRERTVAPGRVIRLLGDSLDGEDLKEIDAEGVAYAAPDGIGKTGYFYVTGSHGLSRRTGELRRSSFFLFRFPVDDATGLPRFGFDDRAPAPEIERTALLRETIKNHPLLSAYAERRLDDNGVTIEGHAARGKDLLFGLRGPSDKGRAFVMSVAFADLFTGAPPPATVTELRLGENVGIRDLAAVSGGVLILAGRTDDGPKVGHAGEARPKPSPSVWFWDVRARDPRTLGTLPGVGPDDKAETLLVLEESGTSYRALVMFDGVRDGRPVEFIIGK